MNTQALNSFERLLVGETNGSPVTEMLQGRVRHWDADAGLLEMNFVGLPCFTNPAGNLQGGMLSAMLDDILGALAQSPLAAGQFAPTLSLNLTFLRAAQPGPLYAKARFIRRGRDVLNIEGSLFQNDQLVAQAVCVSLVRR